MVDTAGRPATSTDPPPQAPTESTEHTAPPEPEASTARAAGDATGRPPGVAADDAFALVRAAFDRDRTRPAEWRQAQLAGIERLLADNEQELLDALADDFGKPRVEAWMADLAPTAHEAARARRHLRRWMRPAGVFAGRTNLPGRAFTVPEPLGTVLVLSPWNYPIQLALSPLVAVLAAGNAAVLKPSELTPACSAALARLVPRYLDSEAVVVVEGAADVATALLEHPFDHVFFTGSTTVGRAVMVAAAQHLASVTLELGGKSPVIVAEDADIEVAARRVAWGKLFNAGQTCIAPDYALVVDEVADRFVDAVVRSMGELQGPDPAATSTRIVNDRHVTRLEGLLSGSGGTVATGGVVDLGERRVAPTVVVGPDPGSPLMQDEIFGPILPVLSVSSVDAAVDFVRGRPKPLALYLFTRSRAVERRVLGRTSSGGVCVNHVAMHFNVPELPFGGVGASGMGAYHGRAGFEQLSHRKPVLRRGSRPDLSAAYPPYDERKERLLRRLL